MHANRAIGAALVNVSKGRISGEPALRSMRRRRRNGNLAGQGVHFPVDPSQLFIGGLHYDKGERAINKKPMSTVGALALGVMVAVLAASCSDSAPASTPATAPSTPTAQPTPSPTPSPGFRSTGRLFSGGSAANMKESRQPAAS